MMEEKLNILFISSWYPGRIQPTLGNFVQKHAEAAALYAKVSVLHICFDTSLRGPETEIIFDANRNVKTLHIYCSRPANPLIRLLRYLKYYRKGLKLITEKNGMPYLVHLNVMFPVGLVFCFLKSYRKLPYVITEHWAGYLPEYHEKTGRLMRYFLRRLIKRAAAVFPVTLDLQQALEEMGCTGNYHVIPNVVDTGIFIPSPEKESEIKKIIHISSLDDDQKNVSGIIRVTEKLFAIRQDFQLHIVGDGDNSLFVEMVKRSGLMNKAIVFHGTMQTHEVAQAIRQADFLVLFSNYENLPCVILEAYACGIPVLTTNTGGIAEHHTPEHGMMISPGDEKELLDAMNRMLDRAENYDKDFLHRYAVQHFSYESVGNQLNEQYRKITAQCLKRS